MNNSQPITADENTTAKPIDVWVTLSQEELLAILHLIGVSTMPGLDKEPLPNISAEQQAFGLIVAERALRARGLATINAEGKLLIRSDILQTIGGYAFSTQGVYVTQIAAPSGAAIRLIARCHKDVWTVHTQPESMLHTFQMVDNRSDVVEQIATFCQWPQGSIEPGFTLTVTGQTLEKVRQMAENGDIDQANNLLIATGNELEAVKKLTDLLSQPHFVTAAQRATTHANDTISVQSVTVLHQDKKLLAAVEQENNDKTFVIQPVSLDRLKHLLIDITLN